VTRLFFYFFRLLSHRWSALVLTHPDICALCRNKM
jgi:hypothetical protein